MCPLPAVRISFQQPLQLPQVHQELHSQVLHAEPGHNLIFIIIFKWIEQQRMSCDYLIQCSATIWYMVLRALFSEMPRYTNPPLASLSRSSSSSMQVAGAGAMLINFSVAKHFGPHDPVCGFVC